MQYYLAMWSLLFGLVIGSFLNVVIYRVPLRESLLRPGSHCPGCGVAIHWHDNIPVAGWLLLRGRCRSCHAPIAVRYPLVESLTGLAFLAAFLWVGPSATLLVAWVFIAVFITLSFVYYDHGLVPDRIVLPAIACGLAAGVVTDQQHWWGYVAGCLGLGLVALLVAAAVPGTSGLSEAKMAALVGAIVGPHVLLAVPAAVVLGLVVGIALLFWQKYRLRARTVSEASAREDVEADRETQRKVDAEVMRWL